MTVSMNGLESPRWLVAKQIIVTLPIDTLLLRPCNGSMRTLVWIFVSVAGVGVGVLDCPVEWVWVMMTRTRGSAASAPAAAANRFRDPDEQAG